MVSKRSQRRKPPLWDLCLYVADRTPRSLLAFENLKKFCEIHLAGQYRIRVVDVIAHPKVARTENIVALPTLVRRAPQPMRRVIGALSDSARILTGLKIESCV